MLRTFTAAAAALSLAPPLALAQESGGITLPAVIGLFNVFVGLMTVAAFLSFGTGLVVWAVRLGTIPREEGLRIMSWGVVILFVLVVILAIVQFFQRNPAIASAAVAFLIIVFFLWVALRVASAPKKEKEDH